MAILSTASAFQPLTERNGPARPGSSSSGKTLSYQLFIFAFALQSAFIPKRGGSVPRPDDDNGSRSGAPAGRRSNTFRTNNAVALGWATLLLGSACRPPVPPPEAEVAYHIIRSRSCTLEELAAHTYQPRRPSEGWGDTTTDHLIWREQFISLANRDTTVHRLRNLLRELGMRPENLSVSTVFAPAAFAVPSSSAAVSPPKRYALCDNNAHFLVYPPQDSARHHGGNFLTVSKGVVLKDSLALYYYEEGSRRRAQSAGYVVLKRRPDGTFASVAEDILWIY